MSQIKRVAAYCRVSTDRQKDEQTVEVQKRFIKEWAQKNEVEIVKWYIDDGWSGDNLVRPALDELREDANIGLWEGVVFVDRDRLARTLAYQEYVIRELDDKRIQIIFLNNPLAEDRQTRILQQFYGIVAEIERIQIAERMRKGKIHKAKSGFIVHGPGAYGYRYVPKVGDKNGYLVVNEPEAEVVRMIFDWVASKDYSMRGVVKELFRRKISSPKGNERWVKSSIERLLKNETYIGKSFYNRRLAVVPKHPQKINGYKKIKKSSRIVRPREEWIEIPVPPIIDRELFDRVQKQLQENQITNRRNRKYDYLLSGKVYCVHGHKRVGDGVREHHYYRSAERIYTYPKPVSGACDCEGINAEILDGMTWAKLATLLSDKELVQQQAERYRSKQGKMTSEYQQTRERLEKALEKLTNEESRALQAYTSGLADFEKFKASAEEIKAKKELLQSQIQNLQDSVPGEDVSLDSFNDVCESLFYRMKHATDYQKKRHIVKNLIKSIYVGERRKALVNGRIPLITQGQNIQDVLISRDSGVAECGEKHAV